MITNFRIWMNIQLKVKIPILLQTVFDNEAISNYERLFNFNMKIRFVCYCLERLWYEQGNDDDLKEYDHSDEKRPTSHRSHRSSRGMFIIDIFIIIITSNEKFITTYHRQQLIINPNQSSINFPLIVHFA